MRRVCGGKLADGPVSVRVCFDRCTSTVTPASQLRISLSEGRVLRRGERGGGIISPSSSSSSSVDSGSEGVSYPCTITTIRVATLVCLLYFRAHNLSLWA
jgi:hypothetical protein